MARSMPLDILNSFKAKADEIQSSLGQDASTGTNVDDLENMESPESLLLSTVSGEQVNSTEYPASFDILNPFTSKKTGLIAQSLLHGSSFSGSKCYIVTPAKR